MPVHSSHLLRYEELRLGERIREIRQHRGVTLRELAAKVDTSPARLSQIENDRLHLALEELEALTAALNVPLEALLPAEQTLPYQIVRDVESRGTAMHPASAGDGRAGSVDATHGLRPLADLFVGRHMEPLLARIEPGRVRVSISATTTNNSSRLCCAGHWSSVSRHQMVSDTSSWSEATACTFARTCRTRFGLLASCRPNACT